MAQRQPLQEGREEEEEEMVVEEQEQEEEDLTVEGPYGAFQGWAKKGDVRALLMDLDDVMWPEAFWKTLTKKVPIYGSVFTDPYTEP